MSAQTGILKAPASEPAALPHRAEIGLSSSPPARKAGLLAANFKRLGWSFQQLARVGRVCLYVKAKAGCSGGLICSWEIVIPRWYPAKTVKGRSFPEGEVYPSDSAWGTAGWTYMSEAGARAAFVEKARARE